MSDNSQQHKSKFHYTYLIVLTGIVITSIPCAMVISCAGIYFNPVSSYFGVSTAEVSLYFSILNIAMMITVPIAGKFMSTADLRIILSACVLIDGLTLITMSFISAVWQLYIAGVLLGIGTGPLIYLAIPTLINSWCRIRVGFFVGLCMAFTGIGGVIFNPIGTAIISLSDESWRMGYLAFGVIILIATLPFTLFIVRSKPADKGLLPYGADQVSEDHEKVLEPEVGVSADKAMKTVAFFTVAAFVGLITLNQMIYQFFPGYVSYLSGSGLPELAAYTGLIASACMAGQALGKVALGVVNDRSATLGLAFGVVLGIVGVLLMMLLPGIALLLLVGSFLFGFVYACTTVESPLLTRTVFGSRDYTNIYSRISMVSALFGAFAAVFWGFIVDLPNGYLLMFVLSLLIMVLSLICGFVALRQGAKLEKTAE